VGPFRGGKPEDIDPDEIKRIMRNLEAAHFAPKVDWQVGDEVRVIEGPFSNMKGQVENVWPDRDTLRAQLKIFGRATPVELTFSQIERL
jgi:transcriptional antiterminator NusG